jgi:hypothetical protein
VVKISSEWFKVPEQGKSSGGIATFSLRTGIAKEFEIAPILDKLLE